MKKYWIGILWMLTCVSMGVAQKTVKVACVGNSVTYGTGIKNRETDSYPAQLQRLLGKGYEVGSFGKPGATLLNKGYRPYTQQEEYRKAVEFAGDWVIIHLGLNDTDPKAWPNYRDEFLHDYLALIDTFRRVNPACRIWVCRMTPIAHRHRRFKSGTRDWYWMIQEKIEQVARWAGVGLIDLQEPLYHRPDLLPDALHPDEEGAGLLAKTVYQAVTGDFGGLKMPAVYSDNMVLQRDRALTIEGTADAGETVTVSIAKQTKTARTPDNGRWTVTLDPMPAQTGLVLTVATPSRKLTYRQVAVGEVWLCSGQSNMAFRTSEADAAERAKLLDFARKNPQIRFFDMKPRWHTGASAWSKTALDSLNHLQYYHDTRWEPCNEQTADRFSAIAMAFGRMLSDSLGVPVGLISNAVGGSPAEAWIDRKTVEFEFPDLLYDWTKNDFIQDWVRERATLNLKEATIPLQRHPYEPCYLFEAGIAPLACYPLKGVLWYQGESNAHNLEAYSKLFPMLVNSWRSYWRETLPFYFVQLSSLNRPTWAWFRDTQRRLAEEIPSCEMAVSSDRGDSLDVHPKRKTDVGERLARIALNRSYGQSSVIPSGPSFLSATFSEQAVWLSFRYAEGLTTSDGKPLCTFELAGEDERFYPAEADIVGHRLRLRSPQVTRPRKVRYGWQPFTRANLINGAELPASTFQAVIE